MTFSCLCEFESLILFGGLANVGMRLICVSPNASAIVFPIGLHCSRAQSLPSCYDGAFYHGLVRLLSLGASKMNREDVQGRGM